jgi:hypothetical protein
VAQQSPRISAVEEDVVDDIATAVSTAQLALSMKEVHGMSKGLHPRQQSVLADWISLLPVIITVALTTREGCDHRCDGTFHDILLSVSTLVALAMH